MAKLDTPFYLTGGTALSRYYFQHRYSDDLDFFVNHNKDFIEIIQKIFLEFEVFCKSNKMLFDTKKIRITEYFCQCFIQKEEVVLKVDFANDVETRFGNIESIENSIKIDSLRNILSNKITALFRYEPKDIADIWIISKNYNFNWEEIFFEAKEKELGIDPIIIAEIINTFPYEKIDNISWINDYDKEKLFNDLKTITKDILSGSDNSLSQTNVNIKDAKPILLSNI